MKIQRATKIVLLNSILASCVLILGCNNSDKDRKDQMHSTVKPISSIVVRTKPYQVAATIEFAGYSQLVHYTMPGINNKKVTATSLVMTPKGPAPAGGWKIVVWAHGTTGVGDTCAPSASDNVAGAGEVLAILLKQGYMVVAPDYEGLGTEGIHPYMNLRSETQSILYSVKAAKELVKNSSNDWLVFGHSQGGHAALGTAQYSSELGYNYKGTVAVAPPSHFMTKMLPHSREIALKLIAPNTQVDPQAANVADLITKSLASTGTPDELPEKLLTYGEGILAEQNSYIAYVGASIRAEIPTFDYNTAFEPAFLTTGSRGEIECLGSLIGAFRNTIRPLIRDGNNIKDLHDIKPSFLSSSTVTSFTKREEPGNIRLPGPILIVQGALDTAVPAIATDALVEKMKGLGSDVTYKVYPSADHINSLVFGLATGDIVNFLQTHMPSK